MGKNNTNHKTGLKTRVHKIKYFHSFKDTLKRIKRQIPVWEKTFVPYKANKSQSK